MEQIKPPLTVLLVDDVQENLDLLEDVLSEGGYRTAVARNGFDALQKLRHEEIHLIIADAMMPRMDGFQLCKEVRAIPGCAKIPFIIYTGNYVDEQDEEFARSIGVDKYVVKYAGLGSLLEAVDELSRSRYGYDSKMAAEEVPVLDESSREVDDIAFLKKHHAIVIRKLEEKMSELELYAETLARRNREIQASEARFRSLFESASVAIFVVDSQTYKVVEANKQGIALLAARATEDVLELPQLSFLVQQDTLEEIFKARTFVSKELVLQRTNGELLDVQVSAGPIVDSKKPRILLFVQDISEQKKMRDRLLQAEKMTLLGLLAGGIAHDIRNPLAAIKVDLEFLKQKCTPELGVSDSIDSAMEGVRRIEEIVEKTLSLARSSKLVVKPEKTNDVLRQALGFITSQLQRKNLQTQLNLSENLPPIQIDANQIQQVFLNVLQNAIDASPKGGTIQIDSGVIAGGFSGGETNPRIFVRIRDQGVGVSSEQLRHLFEPFSTTKAGGTGLGLALSKQIMERHSGDIQVQSAPEGGTVVRLLFPTSATLEGGAHVEG